MKVIKFIKKYQKILLIITLLLQHENIKTQNTPRKIIRNGIIIQKIAPDARSSSMGNIGVSTSPDSFSQYWNPAKYSFSKYHSSIGISYTPYLKKISDNIFLIYKTFNTFLNKDEKKTIAFSIYYFKKGDLKLKKYIKNRLINVGVSYPKEYSIDISYGSKLSDYFSMAAALRYTCSDVFNNIEKVNSKKHIKIKSVKLLNADISGYYEKNNNNKIKKIGFNINNIGTDIKNRKKIIKNFYLPTNIRLGMGYDFIINNEDKLGINLEINKTIINDNKIKNMIKSISNKKNIIKKELEKINYSSGIEYCFDNILNYRIGYFYQSIEKGGNQFLTIGSGLNYENMKFETSYLIPTGKLKKNNPLSNSIRFSVTKNYR